METKKPIQLENSWLTILKEEFDKDYFIQLRQFLTEEKSSYRIFPPGNLIFSAFNRTPFADVKVVILGQDPYHGPGQANGLCFSVSPGIKPPPSLVNIFKELKSDLGIEIPAGGNLEPWADQGVLLLNATLTVRENTAGSHQQKGWETFTNTVIQKISALKQGVVFLLWGNYAKAKESLIDVSKHHILQAPHPSPLARGGFFGCRHFSQTNEILQRQGLSPIDWNLKKETASVI